MAAARSKSDGVEAPHPRENFALYGHAAAEQQFLAAYRTGRMPHAWLIGGEQGIGKATLAYRVARFVLAHPDPNSAEVQAAKTLSVSPDNAVARRIMAQAHGDLLVLERTLNDAGKMRTEIAVDDVRRTVGFFGSTAGEGGWRVCIVDSAEELNRFGANTLLKILEEPPSRGLLIVVSHAPGRLLPTIRSRCRRVMLRPLADDDVAAAAAAALDIAADDAQLLRAVALSEGSVGRAIALYDGTLLALRERVQSLLARLPDVDPQALHALGDSLGRADDGAMETFTDAVRRWIGDQVERGHETRKRARFAEAWDKFNRAAADVDIFNVERKPLVFSTFGLLAEAARG
ncbi:MAG: DNA polymerase III subunit delta' [Xanthobacteraceae bacterium]